MRNVIPCVIAAIASSTFSLAVHSQEIQRIEVPSSFNPVGSGARALGMGGSFISIADDATAASWNPAGLIQLRKPEVALVASTTYLQEDLTFSLEPQASGKQSVNNSDVNYFALSYPCAADKCGKNMVFSLNYQRLFDFSRDWGLEREIQNDFSDLTQNLQHNQTGGLYALGFATAIQLSPKLTLGLTINKWSQLDGKNDWSVSQEDNITGTLTDIGVELRNEFVDTYNFEGLNYNLGVMWNVYQKDEQKATIGLVYKSEFDADISLTKFSLEQTTFEGEDPIPATSQTSSEELELTMPSSIGVGFAFQWSDAFTTSLDIYQTHWSDFAFTNNSGEMFSPISGRPISEARLDDTTQIRFGMEYRITSQEAGKNYIIPLRAGIFRDPLVTELEAENAYGVSVGGGIAFDTWVFDIAYQYRWADDIGKSYITDLGFSQDISEHQLFGSAFYRF